MIGHKKGNRLQITTYYDHGAITHLKLLSGSTRVPMAIYFREALDDLLDKHGIFSGQNKKLTKNQRNA